MRQPQLRFRLLIACIAASALLFHALRADAKPGADLEREAEQAEIAGHWTKARDCYEQLLAKDRGRVEFRKHFLRCHRMAALVQRHQESTYRDHLEKSDLRTTFLVYRDVCTKLRANFVDSEKTEFADLYKYGLVEFRLALENSVFRTERLPLSVSPDAIRSFQRDLADQWSGLLIQSQRELENEINRIAQAARSGLGLDPVVTVMEFACGACHGLDEFTLYLTPRQLSDLYASVKGEVAGIGIEFAIHDGGVWVSHVYPRGPASEAGLEVGDQITHIDGKRLVEPSESSVRSSLAGGEDTPVDITYVRRHDSKERNITLNRDRVYVPSVTDVRVFPEQPGIAYCHVSSFQKSTPQELDDALLQLQMLGMKVLILDLRRNSGGYLPAAIQVTERFLAEGKVIVTTESHVPDEVRIYRATHTTLPALPLVVLVDQETASAAEVVAGALHAHRRATLVGEPTYGKWSMQRVLELKSAGSGICVTLARFLSPGSEPYTNKGIIPDVLEERSPISMADNQLLAAIQVALRLIEMRS